MARLVSDAKKLRINENIERAIEQTVHTPTKITLSPDSVFLISSDNGQLVLTLVLKQGAEQFFTSQTHNTNPLDNIIGQLIRYINNHMAEEYNFYESIQFDRIMSGVYMATIEKEELDT